MIKNFNLNLVIYTLSILLLIEGGFMFLSSMVCLFYKENDFKSLLCASLITLLVGLVLFITTKNRIKKASVKETYFLLTISWIVFSLFGLLPFVFTNAIPDFTDAFFETMSGVTTTGSSILNNVESLSHGLIFWRSIIQWLGGMGTLIVFLAILPLISDLEDVRLLSFDSAKLSTSKLTPRIIQTVKWLWFIYLFITLLETFFLKLAGMSFFDAICHSFSIVSTGGFSTKQNNIAYFNSSTIEYTIIFFMMLSGIGFTLFYYLYRGKFQKIFKNEEFRFYLIVLFVFSFFVALGLYFMNDKTIEESIRLALFYVVSIVTTTGFFTTNFMLWGYVLSTIIVFLMLFGASSASSSGGMKIIRIRLVLKNSFNVFKRFVHPNAILPVRFNNMLVPISIMNNVFTFFLLYIFIAIIGILVMTAINVSFSDSIIIVLSSLGNIGYGTGSNLSSLQSFSSLPYFGKWFLSALMLIGRLEIFAFLVVFSRSFWKK